MDVDAKQRNMHRNIFFQGCASTAEDAVQLFRFAGPEDLWAWMDKQREAGIELLAISHNANVSDGLMYPDRGGLQGPPDRSGLGRIADAQRTADRDQADQGRVGDASVAVAE